MSRQLTHKQRAILITKQSLFVIWIIVKWLFIMGLVGSFLAGGVVAGYVTSLVKDEPIRDKNMMLKQINQYDITGYVYFNDGTLIGQLRTDEDRKLATSISEIPKIVKDAFISVEDDRFYEHPGMSLMGTLRAAKQKFFNEDQQTGGSTITQQLARRVFLSLEQTDSRKFKEIFLAMRMERIMTKDDILLAYLNKMPFGNGSNGYNVHGIKAAAEGIFGVSDLNRLNIAQAAYLAGLLKAPSEYSAYTSRGLFDEEGFNKAMNRQKVVLMRMYEVGNITAEEYEQALKFDVKATLAPTREKAYTTYPYLMIEAEQRAAELLILKNNPNLTLADLRKRENAQLIKDAIDMMNRSGYRIHTTIDKTMYDAMQEIARNPENFTPDHPDKGIEQTGAIMIDNATGKILAMIEGRDYYVEQLNHATQMKRQPGSAMKIMAYLPALELGIIQPGMPIDDVPLILQDGAKGAHIPVNHNGKYHGLITARRAFDQSYNIPALRMFLSEYGGVGIDTAWEYARRMGISTLTESDNRAQTGVIGGLTEGVTVEELTNAYSVVPNKGVFKDAYMIERIEDADGVPIYQHVQTPVTVYSEETAYLMMDMLRTVVTGGTGNLVRSRFEYRDQIPIYGKTGTTSNDHDVWFVGFTPDVSLGVWAGYDQPTKLVSGKGTARARELWALIMNTAVEKKPEWFKTEQIEQPPNIVRATVSAVSGKLPNELTRESNLLSTDLFNKKFLPTQEEDMLTKAKVITYNGFNYFAQPNTPDDFIEEKIVILRQRSNQMIYEELKATFEQYPKSIPARSNLKEPENFATPDKHLDAPTAVDPRVEDGLIPPPPTGLTLEMEDGNYRLNFNPSPAEDVIGYRLYRSRNLGPFIRFSGQVVHAGEKTTFLISPRTDTDTFYVTAVDVGGNESGPSNYVFAKEGMVDPNLLPPVHQGDNGQEPGNEPDPSGDSANLLQPSAPQVISLEAREDGFGIVLQWRASAEHEGVTRYNIYHSATGAEPYQLIGYSEGTRFESISFPYDGWYRVTAVNAFGESSPSQALEIKPAE